MSHIGDLVVANVLEGLPVGILVIGRRGEIEVANPASAEILGYSRLDLLTKGWGELFLSNEANYLFNEVFLDVIQKEKIGLNRDVPYERPDGGRLHLSVTSSFLRSGEELAVVVLLHDVTEIFRMREREYAVLKEQTRLQQEMIGGLRNLALSVAHQIRNPAFAIGGFAKRLADLLAKQGIESEYPGIIAEETGRLERIVASVVRLASLPGATLSQVTLADAAESAAAEAAKRALSLGKRLMFTNVPKNVRVMADEHLLAQCLGELFSNCLDFADAEEVAVSLDAAESGEFVDLSVSDNGPGIAENVLPFVFDPFFTSKSDGVGMGLALAKRIALEHGGDIRVDATGPEGTRIVLRLRRESLTEGMQM